MPKITLLFCLLCILSVPAPAQETKEEGAAPIPHHTFLQWTEMKGKRTQIFIDVHAANQPTYRGVSPQLAATYMVQLPGDESVDLLVYGGTGDDWKWTPVSAHVTLSHPSPGLNRVDFDKPSLMQAHDATVVFRSLDGDWKAIASSKALPWHPN